jgi:D-alanine-D-alanine ligase
MSSALHVAVLMGGQSTEREVSLASGRKVAEAAALLGHQVAAVDIEDLELPDPRPADLSGDGIPQAMQMPRSAEEPAYHLRTLLPERTDVVFIALHGRGGEDGSVQGLLEMLGLPYTGSGVLASALAMNKAVAKAIFEQHGLRTPEGLVFSANGTQPDVTQWARIAAAEVGVPAIVKPASQGSTIGVSWLDDPREFADGLAEALRYDDQALVEKRIEGTEIAAGVLGNDDPIALPLVEIVPAGGRYDYDAKYTPGATEEIVPARIPEAAAQRARSMALSAHQALGCRGMSRADLIAGDQGVYLLEVNTIPGMTSTSLLPRAAEAAGLPFPELVARLLELALEPPS